MSESDPDSPSIEDAKRGADWPNFIQAIDSERKSLEKNNTWELVDQPKEQNILRCFEKKER